MADFRKLTLTSGAGAGNTGRVDFKPKSDDANPLNGVIVKAPDTVGASPITLTLPSSVTTGVIKSDSGGVLSISPVTGSEVGGLTANKAVVTNGSGNLTTSTTSDTEIGYVAGVTSSIQTQLNNKVDTSSGVTLTGAQTLSNKSLIDNSTLIVDDGDNTKAVKFEVSGVSTGTTRTLTIQDSNDTLVGRATTDTLTNKTLTAPVISSIVNTGTLTLPTSTDTLVARATSDVLTNKDVDGGVASNSRRITVPKDTLANITALTRKAGTILYGTDTGSLYIDDGSVLTPLGSGGGSGTQVTVGSGGDYSTISAAIAAVTTDTPILILRGTYTENVTINKRLKISGQGYGTVISGTLTFSSGSDLGYFELCKITGNITLDSGVSGVQLMNFWTNSSATITDNSTGSLIQGIEE